MHAYDARQAGEVMSTRRLERAFRQMEKWDALRAALSAALLVALVACGQEELPPDLRPVDMSFLSPMRS